MPERRHPQPAHRAPEVVGAELVRDEQRRAQREGGQDAEPREAERIAERQPAEEVEAREREVGQQRHDERRVGHREQAPPGAQAVRDEHVEQQDAEVRQLRRELPAAPV